MSTSIEVSRTIKPFSPPAFAEVKESVWQAWVAKGRAEDRRGGEARVRLTKWLAIAALLAAGAFWSNLAPYEIVVRFMVFAAAIVAMSSSIRRRNYPVAVLFGAMMLLYNPVWPVFALAGIWARILVFSSALPFAASLRTARARVESGP
jgi:uncharacterized membrane protein YoaK (UPF0700 family)